MRSVAVYQFLHADEHHSANMIAPRMATRGAIKRVRGMVIAHTETWVDELDLDGSGFYPCRALHRAG